MLCLLFLSLLNEPIMLPTTGYACSTKTNVHSLAVQAKSFKATTQSLNNFVQLPLQSAMQREIARYQLLQVGPAHVHQYVHWGKACQT